MVSYFLILHVMTGTLSVLAGSTALFSAKGSQTHRAAGNLFFVSMILMTLAGSYIAYLLPQMLTMLAGLFTCYLVLTSWLTVIRKPQNTRHVLDIVALLSGLLIGFSCLYFGVEAMNSEDGLKDGFTAQPYFFFAGLALIAAALDSLMIIRGDLSGKHRIARHLWRMCFALYIAVGSLFTGPGMQIFPDSLIGSWMLFIPESFIAFMMLYWLIRVIFTAWQSSSNI